MWITGWFIISKSKEFICEVSFHMRNFGPSISPFFLSHQTIKIWCRAIWWLYWGNNIPWYFLKFKIVTVSSPHYQSNYIIETLHFYHIVISNQITLIQNLRPEYPKFSLIKNSYQKRVQIITKNSTVLHTYDIILPMRVWRKHPTYVILGNRVCVGYYKEKV